MNSKTVLVTGGSGTIGKAICMKLKENNYNVYAGMRKLKHINKIKSVYLDVDDDIIVKRAINLIIKNEGKIDVLINCAGFAQYGALETIDMNQIKKQFETNYFGVVRCIKEVIPHFRRQRSGTIINISSSAGLRGRECCSIYASSKFAIEGLSESLNHELKQFNVKVKIVEPSATKGSFKDNMLFGNKKVQCYDYMDEEMENYFDKNENLLEPNEVAKVVKQALEDNSDNFRYQVGSSVQLAKEKLKEPRRIMKKHNYIVKVWKFFIRKLKF